MKDARLSSEAAFPDGSACQSANRKGRNTRGARNAAKTRRKLSITTCFIRSIASVARAVGWAGTMPRFASGLSTRMAVWIGDSLASTQLLTSLP